MDNFITSILPLLVLALISAISSWIARRREMEQDRDPWEIQDDLPDPVQPVPSRVNQPKSIAPPPPFPQMSGNQPSRGFGSTTKKTSVEIPSIQARVLDTGNASAKPSIPRPPSSHPSLQGVAPQSIPIPDMRNPQRVREAIIASVILSQPKGLDPDF